MTTRYFTGAVRAELERSWFEDGWWTLLLIAADQVQEEYGEVAGEGVRLLEVIRQRVYFGSEGQSRGWWMPLAGVKGDERERLGDLWNGEDEYTNYLPHAFDSPLCVRSTAFYPNDRVAGLDAFLDIYITLTPERRAELWSLAKEVSDGKLANSVA